MPHWAPEIVAGLQRAGFIEKRHSDSHRIFRHPRGRQTQVAMHPAELPHGSFRAILGQAGRPAEAFEHL